MPKPVTARESLDVMLASKGETTNHRFWPKDVLEAVLAAEIVGALRRGPRLAEEAPAFLSRRHLRAAWRLLPARAWK